MRFVKLAYEHLHQIAEIEKEAFSAPWSVNMFIPELASDDAVYLVGEEDGEVVCYGGFHKVLDEGHIMNLAVKERYRGRGLGKTLLSALIARAKLLGVLRMTLEVGVNNRFAIKLYADLGFKPDGMRPNYYPDGEDAVIMWLDI